ncbi:hypothetical protein [Clostridium fallax]|uniref:Uncharacterized protein n=1 Tax=Clostridium fallax TaxID=1533 RepID=A0A1M4XKC4_9CLOT|nr:hypothetical protein [Clostridium fallax]SHE93880.1 hypothetical protein SAMN05443638_11911 [Clostridium fallax]SQB06371.1 Uncharacterised protein [Clostridium fallax]
MNKNFKVIVHYPLPENQLKWQERVDNAAADLILKLYPDNLDEIIEFLEKVKEE